MFACVWVGDMRQWEIYACGRRVHDGTVLSPSYHGACFLCPRWFVYKHSRPLPMEIVHFPPYPDSEDHYRGTTVLPYLEVFYQYDTPEDRANIGK